MKQTHSKKDIYLDAVGQSFRKLSPRIQIKNPVMLVVYIGAIFITALYFLTFAGI